MKSAQSEPIGAQKIVIVYRSPWACSEERFEHNLKGAGLCIACLFAFLYEVNALNKVLAVYDGNICDILPATNLYKILEIPEVSGLGRKAEFDDYDVDDYVNSALGTFFVIR